MFSASLLFSSVLLFVEFSCCLLYDCILDLLISVLDLVDLVLFFLNFKCWPVNVQICSGGFSMISICEGGYRLLNLREVAIVRLSLFWLVDGLHIGLSRIKYCLCHIIF